MTHRNYRTAAGIALGLMAPTMATPAGAKPADKKTAWGAAAAVAGVGAVVEATKDHTMNAILLGAGAAYSYSQYDKARKDEKGDRYGYGDDRYDSGSYRDQGTYVPAQYDSRGNGRYNDNDPYNYDRTNRGPSWRGTPGASDRYSRSTREVTGRVLDTTSSVTRKVKVRLDNGETRTISVPKSASVYRGSRGISVHELKKNEYVRVSLVRYSSNGDLTARRIDTLQNSRTNDRYDDRNDRSGSYDRNNDRYDRNNGYDRDSRDNSRNRDDYSDRDNGYNTSVQLSGTVSSIDSGAGILRMDVDGRRLNVYTDGATIRDSRGTVRLRDLENGDRVTIEARRSGDRITATRITVR